MDTINNTVNPKSALAALFPQPIDCGNGVSVQPFSLATYALLEKMGSYVIFPHEPTQEEVLKTLYICTHDPKEIFRDIDNLLPNAIEWASEQYPSMVEKVTSAIMRQIETVRNAMPPTKEIDAKKAVTDG